MSKSKLVKPNQLEIKKHLTSNHIKYLELLKSKKIILCSGPAGTGKTRLACEVACEFLSKGFVNRIIVTRPAVEAGEKMGFLPGTADEKAEFYLCPMLVNISRCLGENYKSYKLAEKIKYIPIGMMRGHDFHNDFVICDEVQNSTLKQIKMVLTRSAESSTIVLCGDSDQVDIYYENNVPLELVMKLLNKNPIHNDIGLIKLTKEDVLRSDICQFIAERLK